MLRNLTENVDNMKGQMDYVKTVRKQDRKIGNSKKESKRNARC